MVVLGHLMAHPAIAGNDLASMMFSDLLLHFLPHPVAEELAIDDDFRSLPRGLRAVPTPRTASSMVKTLPCWDSGWISWKPTVRREVVTM